MYLKTLHGCERATYFSLTREIRFAALQGPNRSRRGLIQLLVYAIYLVYQVVIRKIKMDFQFTLT